MLTVSQVRLLTLSLDNLHPMNPALILSAIFTYGPEILPLIHQVSTWVQNKKTDVTPDDIKQLIAYGEKSSADYLKEVGLT